MWVCALLCFFRSPICATQSIPSSQTKYYFYSILLMIPVLRESEGLELELYHKYQYEVDVLLSYRSHLEPVGLIYRVGCASLFGLFFSYNTSSIDILPDYVTMWVHALLKPSLSSEGKGKTNKHLEGQKPTYILYSIWYCNTIHGRRSRRGGTIILLHHRGAIILAAVVLGLSWCFSQQYVRRKATGSRYQQECQAARSNWPRYRTNNKAAANKQHGRTDPRIERTTRASAWRGGKRVGMRRGGGGRGPLLNLVLRSIVNRRVHCTLMMAYVFLRAPITSHGRKKNKACGTVWYKQIVLCR